MNDVRENFPRYGRYCGLNYSHNWKDGATINDAPQDVKDAICWLHDAETGKSTKYEDYFDRASAWNTASKFFNYRLNNQEEMKVFSDNWWSRKVLSQVDIPIMSYDEEFSKIYKPGSKKLFGFIYFPILRNDKLLENSIDESLAGPPPKPE